MTGIEAFLEVLAAAGVRHIFGNPGTTELPLNAALARDRRFHYIFGIHEIPVVTMADGFALASGSAGVVNVHISCGLGNAMGMIYNAHVEGSPLLITAGQQDRRLRLSEPVLEGDLVSVARPWTKWAHEVQRVEDIPRAVRRALQTALTPPTGPVFLSLPVDVQLEETPVADRQAPHIPDRRVRPPLEALGRAADLLRTAKSPAILAGSRVTEADGCAELTALAERLGAPVFAETGTMHGRLADGAGPSALSRRVAAVDAGHPPDAGQIRCLSRRRPQPVPALHLRRTGMAAARTRPPDPPGQRTARDRQELSRRRRSDGRSESRAGGADGVAHGAWQVSIP